MRTAQSTIWIATCAGWAAVTAAFLTVPPLRQMLPIGRATEPSAAEAILAERDAATRLARIESLPDAGEKAAGQLSAIALYAGDGATAAAAIAALARAEGGARHLAEIGRRPHLGLAAIRALGESSGTDAVLAIIDLLGTARESELRAAAFHALARHGGFTATLTILETAAAPPVASGSDRALAIDALADVRDPAAAATIVPWLRTTGADDFNVAILRALGRLEDGSAALAVSGFLERSPSAAARLAAIETLARIGNASSVRVLTAVRDRGISVEERDAASDALASLRGQGERAPAKR